MLDSIKNAILYGKDFCEDTAENLRETIVTAVDKTKLQYKITAQRNALNALYAAYGKMQYDGKNGDESSEMLENLGQRIQQKEELLFGLEEQYRIVSGKVICPECGRFMSEKYRFCPFCGRENLKGEDYMEMDVSEDDLYEIREIDEL